MAVVTKILQEKCLLELEERYNNLRFILKGRELKSSTEGTKRGSWIHPERLSFVDNMRLRIEIAGFNAILSELKRIK